MNGSRLLPVLAIGLVLISAGWLGAHDELTPDRTATLLLAAALELVAFILVGDRQAPLSRLIVVVGLLVANSVLAEAMLGGLGAGGLLVSRGELLATAAAAVWYGVAHPPTLTALRTRVAAAVAAPLLGFLSIGLVQRLAGVSEPDVLRVSIALWLAGILLLLGIGLLGDLRPVLQRAQARAPARGLLRAVVDELSPNLAARLAEASEAERGRLAADLHADVLPALRLALASAEASGSVESLAVALRDVVDDVEGLLAERRSIVLEEFGLLAGIEWLAERAEERGAIEVSIEVGDHESTRPPRPVERACFRIVGLALDNSLRHAPASAVSIRATITAARVAIEVRDYGPGFSLSLAEARRAGRRGVADMAAEAAAAGLTFTISDECDGVIVRIEWSLEAGARPR